MATTMEGIEWKGSIYRIRECAFDFLSMEEDLIDDEGEDSWELMQRDVNLKSTFLYCDLNRIISSSRDGFKETLTGLSNRLFYFMQELGHAVKRRSVSQTRVHFNDAALVLQELMTALLIDPPLDQRVI